MIICVYIELYSIQRGFIKIILINPLLKPIWDFPGGPVVKTLPFNAEGVSLIPGWGAKTPHISQPKKKKKAKAEVVKNSIKTLKMVHIKKIFKYLFNKINKYINL